MKRLVQDLLRDLALSEAGTQGVEVRVLSGAPDRVEASVLSIEDADQRIDELLTGGRSTLLRTVSAALAEGRDAQCSMLDRRDAVWDFDAEIAHGAALHAPVTLPVSRGLTAGFAAARTAHGTRLDWAIREIEDAEPRRIEPRPRPWFASPFPDAPIDHGEEQALGIDALTRHLWSGAGSIELPDGKALHLPCRVATQLGECAFLLDVRVVGPRGPEPELALVPSGSTRLLGFDMPELGENALCSRTGQRVIPREGPRSRITGGGTTIADRGSSAAGILRRLPRSIGPDDS